MNEQPPGPADDASGEPTPESGIDAADGADARTAAPIGPPPQWTPPSGPLPAVPTRPWWDLGTQPSAYAGEPASVARTTTRPSGWIWPVVAAVALVLGLLGGVAGAIAWENAADDSAAPSAYDGLQDDAIVEQPPVEPGRGVAGVARAVLPSTVQIIAEYEGDPEGATGSGFVIDVDGHIVTNNHVVASAAEGEGQVQVVDQAGNTFEAEIVGRSSVYDLAVLQIPDDAGLEPAALGASRSLRVGDGVIAIGSPLGLSATVTAGIVSALNRPVTTGSIGDDSSYINAVQTDAAINPGNSGGPLVNMRGQVIGVNSAIATSGGATNGEAGNIGVGFAIPVEQVRITTDQILSTGEARYPVIGAQVGDDDASVTGAQISEVMADTPAETAGLEKGDVVVEVGGQRVTDGISLIVSIRTHQPGETVDFVYVRDGRERTVTIRLDSEVG